MAFFFFRRRNMDDPKPTEDHPAMESEPMEHSSRTLDDQPTDPVPANDDWLLEEAGYGYGV
jgi:hypothetical protein